MKRAERIWKHLNAAEGALLATYVAREDAMRGPMTDGRHAMLATIHARRIERAFRRMERWHAALWAEGCQSGSTIKG